MRRPSMFCFSDYHVFCLKAVVVGGASARSSVQWRKINRLRVRRSYWPAAAPLLAFGCSCNSRFVVRSIQAVSRSVARPIYRCTAHVVGRPAGRAAVFREGNWTKIMLARPPRCDTEQCGVQGTNSREISSGESRLYFSLFQNVCN